jgi:HAD superfamily hydrolase (TIGR01509 family)
MRAVVFDMDGLMFNTEDVYTLVGRELARRRGHTFTNELKKEMMGTPPREAFKTMIRLLQLPDTWEELAAESNAFFLEIVADHIQPMPGLFALLDRLEKAAIPKAIATSSAKKLMDACLAAFDLHSRFQFFLTAEDVIQGKPNPEIYLAAAERFGIAPSEMVVLEDSHNGCIAAALAGAYAVAVPGDHSSDHDFSKASLVISSLADPQLYTLLGFYDEGVFTNKAE